MGIIYVWENFRERITSQKVVALDLANARQCQPSYSNKINIIVSRTSDF